MRYFSYRNKMRLRTALITLLITLAVLAVIAIGVFVYLQRYVVYTPDGAHLDFSTRPGAGTPNDSPVNPNFDVEESPILPDAGIILDGTAEDAGISALTKLAGYYVTGEMLSDTSAVLDALGTVSEPTAVLLDVKSVYGNYYYSTSVSGADTSSLVDAAAVDTLIENLAAMQNVYLIARLPAFRDSAFALSNQDSGLPLSSGALWMDSESCYWLDPAEGKVITRLESIALELQSLGFDEVVYDDFYFPDSPNIAYDNDRDAVVADAAKRLSANLAGEDIVFSLCSSSLSLAAYASRLYVSGIDGADVQSLAQSLESVYSPLQEHLVFLTDSRDTRFADYGLLQPLFESES